MVDLAEYIDAADADTMLEPRINLLICLHHSREDKAKQGYCEYFRIEITEKVLDDSENCRHRRCRNIALDCTGHRHGHMATDSGVVLNQTADRQTTANRIKQAGLAAGRVFFVKRLTRTKYDSICSSLDCSLLRSARLFYAFISTKSGKLGTSVCINRMPSYLFTS